MSVEKPGYITGVAKVIQNKLDHYSSIVASKTSTLARILDPRLPNDLLTDEVILCAFVPSSEPTYTSGNSRHLPGEGDNEVKNENDTQPLLAQLINNFLFQCY